MNDFGKRLREERERLGLNQTEFGALGGVKKLTQLKYEKAERVPSIRYFDLLRPHGVDVEYILSGLHDNPEGPVAHAYGLVLWIIALFIDLNADELEEICDLAVKHKQLSMIGKKVNDSVLFERISDLLDACPNLLKPTQDYHGKLVDDLCEQLEAASQKAAVTLSDEAKIRAFSILYRAFRKTGGEIDQTMLDDVVALAAGKPLSR